MKCRAHRCDNCRSMALRDYPAERALCPALVWKRCLVPSAGGVLAPGSGIRCRDLSHAGSTIVCAEMHRPADVTVIAVLPLGLPAFMSQYDVSCPAMLRRPGGLMVKSWRALAAGVLPRCCAPPRCCVRRDCLPGTVRTAIGNSHRGSQRFGAHGASLQPPCGEGICRLRKRL